MEKVKIKKELINGRGQPSVLLAYDISEDRIVRTYESWGSCRKAADILGIHHSTVSKYLREAGIKVNESGWSYVNTEKLRDRHLHKRKGKFAQWLRDHQNVQLPRDYKKIAEITNLNYDTIRGYFRRNEEDLQKFISEYFYQKKLMHMNLPLDSYVQGDSGEKIVIKTGKLFRYNIFGDKFTNKIKIIGYINAKEGIFRVEYIPYNLIELKEIIDYFQE